MPQIYADKLEGQLKQTLASVYCIAGDDILQRREAAEKVRETARASDYSGLEKHYQDRDFKWQDWLASGQAMSLFSEKRIVELQLESGKIGTEGSGAVVEFIERLTQSPENDTLLLIISPAVSGKPKWINSIIKHGLYVPVYPLEGDRLEQWLIRRAASKKLKLSRQGAALLSERVEGNSVAADQELEKLALLLDENSSISEENINEWVADNARFSVFKMLDRAIEGDARSSCRALQHLRDEGTVIPAIVPALGNRLTALLNLAEHHNNGQLSKGFQSERIFPKQQAAYQRALKKLDARKLHQCFKLCSAADICSKRGEEAQAWVLLETLLCELAGLPTQQTALLLDAQRY